MPFKKGAPRPANSGRKKGQKSNRTMTIAEITEAAIALGETPVEFMLRKMRDKKSTDAVQREMAKAAAPYVHPRLASQDVKLDDNTQAKGKTSAELKQKLLEDLISWGIVTPQAATNVLENKDDGRDNVVSDSVPDGAGVDLGSNGIANIPMPNADGSETVN